MVGESAGTPVNDMARAFCAVSLWLSGENLGDSEQCGCPFEEGSIKDPHSQQSSLSPAL